MEDLEEKSIASLLRRLTDGAEVAGRQFEAIKVSSTNKRIMAASRLRLLALVFGLLVRLID